MQTLQTCTPIMKRAPKKQGKPPHMPGGGTMANMSFQGTVRKCMTLAAADEPLAGTIAPWRDCTCKGRNAGANTRGQVRRRAVCEKGCHAGVRSGCLMRGRGALVRGRTQSSRASERLSALRRSSETMRSSLLVSSSSLRMTTVATYEQSRSRVVA